MSVGRRSRRRLSVNWYICGPALQIVIFCATLLSRCRRSYLQVKTPIHELLLLRCSTRPDSTRVPHALKKSRKNRIRSVGSEPPAIPGMTSVSPVSVSPPFRPLPTFFQAFTSTSETTTPSITSTPRSLLSTAPLRPTQNDQVQEQVRVQEQQLANIARMQQRQEEWSAAAARSTSGSAGIRTRTGTSVSASSVSRSPSASGSARGRSSSAEGETAVQPARSGAGHARAIAIASGSGNGVREIKVKKEDRGDTATGSWGTVAGGSMMPGLGAGSGSGTAKKGRKKVAKACLACQKSHVTCDDSGLLWLYVKIL